MPLPILRRSRKLTSDVLVQRAVKVAVNPRLMDTFPDGERKQLAPVVKALQAGASGPTSSRGMQNARALAASTIAQRAHQNLAASVGLTPSDIQLALQEQGLDWVQPFAPGAPLTPVARVGQSSKGCTGVRVRTSTGAAASAKRSASPVVPTTNP
jgi:hypothetical protein